MNNFDKVLKYFNEIAAIPHGSGNMSAIANYCVNFALERHLECYRDSADNVIIKKPATPTHKNGTAVILQGHLDMVCDKESSASTDPEADGVTVIVDGDYIKADKTTLGADNGIAVAYALAILDSDNIEHPELEVLLTTDEEIGMIGATALDASLLKGKTLLNIDSEEEGYFTASCAGGLRSDFCFHVDRANVDGHCYKISVSGLLGGHSGAEIDKGRANAYILLGGVLKAFEHHFPVRLIDIGGGGKDNAIAKYAYAKILLPFNCYNELKDIVDLYTKNIRSDFKESDPGITLTVEHDNYDWSPISVERSNDIINFLNEAPNGITKMSDTFQGYPDTSLNLGVVRSSTENVQITFSLRSFSDASRDSLLDTLAQTCFKYHGSYSTHGKYPAWPFKEGSHLCDVMTKCYKKMFGKEAIVCPIHAGLECGVLSSKIDGLDCISFGPDLYDVHTPREKMSISSARRIWELILEVLKTI